MILYLLGRALVSLNTSDFLENYEQSDESIVLDSVTAIKSIDVNSSCKFNIFWNKTF